MYTVYLRKEERGMKSLNLKPINKIQTAQDKAYVAIKNAVLNGEISNTTFITETSLAEVLEISRTPIRAALQDLLKEGLLIHTRGRGFQIRRITLEEQDEIFVLRESLEARVIEKITANFTEEMFDQLTAIIQKQQKAVDQQNQIEFIDIDQEFHLTLARMAGYEIIEEVLLNVHNLTQLMGLKAIGRQGRMVEVIEEHKNIVNSLQAGTTEETLDLMSVHLERTKKTLDNIDTE